MRIAPNVKISENPRKTMIGNRPANSKNILGRSTEKTSSKTKHTSAMTAGMMRIGTCPSPSKNHKYPNPTKNRPASNPPAQSKTMAQTAQCNDNAASRNLSDKLCSPYVRSIAILAVGKDGREGAGPTPDRPAGWCFGRRRRRKFCGRCLADIKRCQMGHRTPPHGQALARLDGAAPVALGSIQPFEAPHTNGASRLSPIYPQPVGKLSIC